ncbi:MAG: universal stress protein [Firmicutes bacterium]|nr:universal stress protein [Bacillota bacterium]MCM1400846.1 universal stress protein [Bacteroides sp.]MCM1476663.1 universal stress protein [Bacteroides sp.]
MQEKNPLITVAIHTLHYACSLKSLLEKEGIKVTLQNVNLSNPTIAAGVRVRIQESDLPTALRIIENPEVFSKEQLLDSNELPTILVPIDFSTHSSAACHTAFHFAKAQGATITLLHSFLDPIYSKRSQLNDSLTFDNDSVHDAATSQEINQADKLMELFENSLVEKIKTGEIPAIKFAHEISEGIPEDVINEFAREHHPLMIVMGTRNANDKARDLVGSVAAEVLDTCRYPIMTIPESAKLGDMGTLDNILFFSNFDQQDILAIDTMFHLLPPKAVNVCLVKLPSKKFNGDVEAPLWQLKNYCEEHYPIHTFAIDTMEFNSVEDDFLRIIKSNAVDLIVVPNKKKNMFARFFNPGVAHRLLFHTDMPMLVIPI